LTSISISPPAKAPEMTVRPPGSKSHTIRALVAAGGAKGASTLLGALDSEDTRRARDCLAATGVGFEIEGDRWLVEGTDGNFEAPMAPLDVGESGLTARFILALSPFLPTQLELRGQGRLPERPMDALFDNLEQRGATVVRTYPWRVDATGAARSGRFSVDASTSSQVVSALLLAAPMASDPTTLMVDSLHSSARYISLTTDVMRRFGAEVEATGDGYQVGGGDGYKPTRYHVPVDASSAVYPACAAALTGGTIEILGDLGQHPDRKIFEVLEEMGCTVTSSEGGTTVTGPASLSPITVDMSAAPDAAVALAVICARAGGRSRIAGLHSLRLKESDRLAALHSELTRFGSQVAVVNDSLEISPGNEAEVEFDSHNDHRIAMSLALLGLVAPGTSVNNPEVVNKTWPGYWEWLGSSGAILTKSE
jgi:3-phosphoshikimate 1-carboxyvinyltransferase